MVLASIRIFTDLGLLNTFRIEYEVRPKRVSHVHMGISAARVDLPRRVLKRNKNIFLKIPNNVNTNVFYKKLCSEPLEKRKYVSLFIIVTAIYN